MYLIAGLGNPGRRYVKTRHNAGFMLVDRVAAGASIAFNLSGDALIGAGHLGGQPVLLAKPQTYMNVSGLSVKRLVDAHDTELERVLIVFDDAALPLGTLRFRPGGSAGGQKGMRSVIEKLGTPEVARLRIGVGDPETEPADLSDFVLGRFSSDERALLDPVLDEGAEGVTTFVTEGIERAMARHNSRRPTEEGGGR